jgi:glycerol-3-phosphate acyltransferase PlsY
MDNEELRFLIFKLRFVGVMILIGGPFFMYMGFRDGKTWSIVAGALFLLSAVWMLYRAKHYSQVLVGREDNSSASDL